MPGVSQVRIRVVQRHCAPWTTSPAPSRARPVRRRRRGNLGAIDLVGSNRQKVRCHVARERRPHQACAPSRRDRVGLSDRTYCFIGGKIEMFEYR
jgi:hypothetical protein